MGNCYSDVEGGKQAVGGAQQRPNSIATTNNNGGHNDAVEFFFRSHGIQPLFTQIELSLSASNLLDRDITSKAILEVGEVIQFYDTDRRFPAWGFGGRTCNGTSSHYFNLKGSAGVFEVEGIMAAYSSALHNVSLARPTLFSQVINKATQIAGQSFSYKSNKYFVLLIITISVVQALLEELLGQFLTYMRVEISSHAFST